MAEYKVPQDVEADDKLLGPFTFRQFIYLMVSGGCIALAVALFQVFPLLIIIPAPVAIFFAILALPLKKDQPMETYLAAIVSFHLKPKKRTWTPGQRESTIMITAPKIVEENRTRDITGEEASTRLSFLANIIDTEGYAIRNNTTTPMREDFLANNIDTPDMFDEYSTSNLDSMITRNQNARRATLVSQMRTAIENANNVLPQQSIKQPGNQQSQPTIQQSQYQPAIQQSSPQYQSTPNNQPTPSTTQPFTTPPTSSPQPTYINPLNSPTVIQPSNLQNQSIKPNYAQKVSSKDKNIEAKLRALANNNDFSIETIAKEAKRINKKDNDEVYISLH